MNRDYYKVLGLSKNASEKEIKSAYRRHALKYHPDRNQDNPSAEAKFKEASEAYEVLGDKGKRASYDKFGHSAMGGADNFDPNAFDLNDFFGDFKDFFGSGGRKSSSASSPSVIKLAIDLKEAVFGINKKLRMSAKQTCATCNGSKCRAGFSLKKCKTCMGKGSVKNGGGFISFVSSCSGCGGSGVFPEKPCLSCSGSGFMMKSSNLEITIPAGVDTGDTLRVSGRGEYDAQSRRPSDLFIKIFVKESDEFRRDGNNIYSDIHIDFIDTIIGGKVKVNTIHGEHYISISECTKPGTVFRLRGKGVKSFGSNTTGDHFVNTNIKIPDSITKRQRELLSKFSEE